MSSVSSWWSRTSINSFAERACDPNVPDHVRRIVEIQGQATSLVEDGPAVVWDARRRFPIAPLASTPEEKPHGLIFQEDLSYAYVGEIKEIVQLDSIFNLEDSTWEPQELDRIRFSAAHRKALALGDQFATNVWYGGKVTELQDDPRNPFRDNPAVFSGFSDNYSSLDSDQVIDGGGRGERNSSIWFIGWGELASFFVFPDSWDGSDNMLGFEFHSRDDVPIAPPTDIPELKVDELHVQQKVALAIANREANVRIANVWVASPFSGGLGMAELADLFQKALEDGDFRSALNGAPLIYCSRGVYSALMHKRNRKGFRDEGFAWGPSGALRWLGIPIRCSRQLRDDEPQVA